MPGIQCALLLDKSNAVKMGIEDGSPQSSQCFGADESSDGMPKTTRRCGTEPENGMILNSKWSFSVSAVAGMTLMARPLATMWRMVLMELPCRVLVRPWIFCLAASSEQLDKT